MSKKIIKKYRNESTRLQRWNYGWNAAYFVTICTKNRICHFGDIDEASEMQLSEIGQIANDYWLDIPNHFPFVKLGNHIVMPNHVHGIIIIDKPDDGRGLDETNMVDNANDVGTPKLGVPTSELSTANASKKWKPGTLGVIINQYKRACTIEARKINIEFAWQSRFHDHIIRDEKSFDNISNYIQDNPLNWNKDDFRL